jgi:hypothetical protein
VTTPLEKTEEHWGDQFMELHGYTVIRISQTRATMQTCGIPDRKYFHPVWGHALWWEVKRQKHGRVSGAQFAFALLAKACGEEHVIGPFDALRRYMEQRLPDLRRRVQEPPRNAMHAKARALTDETLTPVTEQAS